VARGTAPHCVLLSAVPRNLCVGGKGLFPTGAQRDNSTPPAHVAEEHAAPQKVMRQYIAMRAAAATFVREKKKIT